MNKILVIDDDNDVRERLVKLLKAKSFNIEEAKSVPEGKILIKNNNYQVVLVDLVFPENEYGGIDIMKFVDENKPYTIVILMTAYKKKLDKLSDHERREYFFINKNEPNVDIGQKIVEVINNAIRYYHRSQTLLYKNFFPLKKIDNLDETLDNTINQKKYITVLFADIKNSTNFLESLDQGLEFFVDFMQEFFSSSTDIILKYDGLLDKFIGDEIMALFGAFGPVTFDNKRWRCDAVKALHCSYEIKRLFYKLKEKRRIDSEAMGVDIKKVYRKFGLSIGLSSGHAFITNIGTPQRIQITAFGHNSVVLASRIMNCQAATKNRIVCSKTTQTLLDPTLEPYKKDFLFKGFEGKNYVYDISELAKIHNCERYDEALCDSCPVGK